MCNSCCFAVNKNLLRAVAHAQAGQVAVTEGKEDHEDDEDAVMMEEDGEVEPRLDVTQHEERDKNQATGDGSGQQQAVLLRLESQELIRRVLSF